VLPEAGLSNPSTEIGWHTVNLSEASTNAANLNQKTKDWFFQKRVRANIKFESKTWRNSMDRLELLSAFVYDYPVIGMEKAEVHTLLGNPLKQLTRANNDVYVVNAGARCAVIGSKAKNATTYFELSYENNKVEGFRTFTK
jgi:hypothetical protein